MTASALFTWSIAYSRMILGVHSLNQVIYGGSIGIWLALFVYFILREPLLRHLKKLQAREEKRYA